jgi:hypothetical protein
MSLLAAFLLAPVFAASDVPITLRGIGELRVGLSAEALRTRFRAAREEGFSDEDSCSYWRTPDFPGLALMVVDGRLVRIDVDDARYRTRSGATIGMRENEFRAIYGRNMIVEPHPYTAPEGHYLVYQARGEPYGMIVETDNGRAISLRVGYWENVQWIEGCS